MVKVIFDQILFELGRNLENELKKISTKFWTS